MRGLYAIADTAFLRARGADVVDFTKRVLAARPAALQLRAKAETPRDALALLRALAPLARVARVPLFANDRPDLAILAGCDGVHVGQDDLGVAAVRRVGPRLRVGLSTHSEEELRSALAERPDYVALGPIFPTSSKDGTGAALGLAGLARLAALAREAGVPLVAIGGVDLAGARRVAEHVPAAAAIAALWPEAGLSGVEARARALHRALGGD